MYLIGGITTVSHSAIIRSHSRGSSANSDGGCFLIGIGDSELHLISATIEQSTSFDSKGMILAVESDPSGSTSLTRGPLVVATSTEFLQHACAGSLFYQMGPAQLFLRNISFTPLPGCDTTSLMSPAAFFNVTIKECGQTCTDNKGEWGVCTSTTSRPCTSMPVALTLLQSLTCECPDYRRICPVPSQRRLQRLVGFAVISKSVRIGLSKPMQMEADHPPEPWLNVTLYVKGTDISSLVDWTLLNAWQILNRSQWLRLPAVTGETDPPRRFAPTRLPAQKVLSLNGGGARSLNGGGATSVGRVTIGRATTTKGRALEGR
jgi:hypothetical protein